jgi:UDP-glucose 4-epimerase
VRILISGVAGFIGSHVADALRNGKNTVLGIDNFSTGRMENLTGFLADGGFFSQSDVRLCEGDISSFPIVSEIFNTFRPEAVIHLAAQAAISTSIENPVRDMEINGIGTLNMLNASLKFNVRHFVLSSTSAVYRESKCFKTKEDGALEPNTPYGVSKLAAEMYTRSMFSGAVILRFGNVYGPRQVPIGDNQLISRMIRHFKYGDKFYIHGSGEQKRDFVYVSDVVNAVVAGVFGKAGTYNIASGQSISVNEIATIIEKRFGVFGYKWDHTAIEDKRKRVCLEIKEASHGLYWKPQVSIIEGINKTVSWWDREGMA